MPTAASESGPGRKGRGGAVKCRWADRRNAGPGGCATIVVVTRIVAGTVGGRRIEVPPRGTRPTSEKVREAVFNSLESLTELDGARILDLYGGSGALGFEALSRGAGHATFVEADKRAAGVLRANAKSLGFGDVRVEQAKAETLLAAPASEPFDVVLADPPYDLSQTALRRLLDGLVAGGWTAFQGPGFAAAGRKTWSIVL